ncbi:MAG: hypothetical protein ACOCXJ_02970, partial [Planctomycetota bacterium]
MHTSRPIRVACALCACLLLLGLTSQLTAMEQSVEQEISELKQQGAAFAAIAAQVSPAVVNIQTEATLDPAMERRFLPRIPGLPEEFFRGPRGRG